MLCVHASDVRHFLTEAEVFPLPVWVDGREPTKRKSGSMSYVTLARSYTLQRGGNTPKTKRNTEKNFHDRKSLNNTSKYIFLDGWNLNSTKIFFTYWNIEYIFEIKINLFLVAMNRKRRIFLRSIYFSLLRHEHHKNCGEMCTNPLQWTQRR